MENKGHCQVAFIRHAEAQHNVDMRNYFACNNINSDHITQHIKTPEYLTTFKYNLEYLDASLTPEGY